MGKVFRFLSKVSKIASVIAAVIPGGQLISAAFAINSALMGALGKKKKKIQQQERLYATLDTAAARKQVFGLTAGGTDIRYEEWYGTGQEYLSRIVAVASHKVQEIREIWFDDKVAWTLAGGVQGEFVGYLTVDVRLEGTSANTISINGGAKWGANCRLTGCAYVHLKYKVTGNSKKTESPFASNITSRITIVTAGRLLYDPRKDSTVPGGSGAHRANDQTTWEWQSDVKGRNLALHVLNYLLGWKINGKLAVGKGIPQERLDLESWIVAANIAEETVALAGGGTEYRYLGGFVASEDDQPQAVLDAALSGCAALLTDAGGKIGIKILTNDLASIAADFTADDVIGPFSWEPGLALDQLPNTIRGQYISKTTSALYREVDFPQVTLASLDGIERTRKLDFPVIESGYHAQRIAKMELQRLQYQGVFKATMFPTNLRAGVTEIARWTFSPLGFSNKLFRVVKTVMQPNGLAEVWFREENAAIYAWSAEEAALVTPAAPTTYNPLNTPLIAAALEETDPNILGISEKIRTLIPDEAAREARYTQVTARATFLGLSFTSLSTARSNWVAYLATLSPAWNDIGINTPIVRTTFRGYLDTYLAAFEALDQLISAEDAKWTQTTGRPPLLTGQNLTVDENFLDTSAWSASGITFGVETTGEGYIRQTGTPTGVITHLPKYAVPIDFNATYEGTWDVQEEGAGAGAGIFYTVVQLYDASGINISGDGSYWFYPASGISVVAKGSYETYSARFGKGTDRPFPANAVKMSVGYILNYTNLNTSMRGRRAYFRRITTLEMKATYPYQWALGDGKAIRHIGITSWGQYPAHGRTTIQGPQRFTFRFSGPDSGGTAKMAGLTESSNPTSYSNGAMLIYYLDTAGRIEVSEAGVETATYTGVTNRLTDEWGIEYDGLYLYPLQNGARTGHKTLVGPGKSYRAMVDTYYPGQGIVQMKHESTASAAVIGGNTVDVNGNPVSLDALRNNMIDTSWWKKGATIPWGATGGGTTAIVSTPFDVNIEGFKTNPEDVMRVTKTGASGATIGGGWGDGTPTRITGIDPDKTYRFVLPVRHVGGDTSLYWGVDGDSVCDINTTTPDTNPYFVAAGSGVLQTDRWYVFVGFIYPRNSTGKYNDSAGIYDCRTGKKVVNGENFCFRPSFTEVRHRAFQYYGVVDSTSVFNKPIVNVVDGSEPELSTFFEVTSSLEDVSLDWVTTGGHAARGNSISKVLGSTGAWNSKAITKQNYKSNAFISGRLETDNTFLGLHVLGDTDADYYSLYYAFHRTTGGGLLVYKDGVSQLSMGTSYNGVTFTSTTDLAIFYDNATIKMYADGVSMYEIAATPDLTLQGGVVCYDATGLVSNVRFGPFTENTMVTVIPLGDVDIAADYTGTILSTQFNITLTPTIKRGGVDFRTNNRMTYELTSKTGGITTAGYVDVNNTTASADKGRVTITNCSGAGTFVYNAKYDGVIISSFLVKLNIKPADAPIGGGGGGGTKSGSFSVAGLTASGTTYVEKGRISGLVKGTGETIRAYLTADYTLSHTSTISRYMLLKWQYSVAGAESWTDFAAAATGSTITYIAEDFASDTGTITANPTVAPANNTYDIRLVEAVSAAGGTLTFGLGYTASVIIGV